MHADLKELAGRGLITRKRSDPAAVAKWCERSRSDIELSRRSATRSRSVPCRSAYEASLRACAGILDLAGHRVRTQQGHHWAIIEAAGAVLGTKYAGAIKRIDDARKHRNDDLYAEAAPPSAGRRDEAIADAEDLVAELELRLAQARSSNLPRGRR